VASSRCKRSNGLAPLDARTYHAVAPMWSEA
jgi:hypothetical protein